MGRRLRRLFGAQPRRPPASPMLEGQYSPRVETIAAAFDHDAIYCEVIPHSPPCTGSIKSNAKTVKEIIEELRHTKTSERSGRAQDKESEDAFEKLRRDGYM